MIGPAEIAEMEAERAEALAEADAHKKRDVWPSFVAEQHLDAADRQLIGSFALWVSTNPALSD